MYMNYILNGGKITICPPRIAYGGSTKQLDTRLYRKRQREFKNGK